MRAPTPTEASAPVTPVPAAGEAPPAAPARRPGLLRRFLRKPGAVVAAAFLLLLTLACVAAPVVAPYGESEAILADASSGPSAAHWLGTDNLGYDVFSRLLYGGANTLGPAALSVLIAGVVGVPVGMAAGFRAGRLDRIVGWVLDGVMSIPSTIFLLAVLAVFPHNMTVAMAFFGLLISPPVARVVRSVVLGVRAEQYIDVARVSGIGDAGIIWRHVRSKLAGVVVVQLTLVAGISIVAQSGLEFLGLGPQPPAPTWGNLVSTAAESIHRQPWLLVPTGGVIALVVIALWFVGDGLRDALAERWQGPPTTRGRRAPAPAETAARSRSLPADAGVLVLDGLTVSFGDGADRHPVVQDVALSVAAGETVALLGESGCGKSVTARAAAGLLPSTAHVDAGTVVLDGTTYDLTGRGPDLPRGAGIAMIFQEPVAALDPTLTVGALLTGSVRRHTGVDRKAARERALELVRQVGIRDPESVLRRYPHELSGGMAQRVCIARALAGRPKVLVADEPTTALDVTVQQGVLDLLRERQAETGLGILFVTHDWGVVADIATRCVVMYAGQVVEVAGVDDLFAGPRHPYSRGLMAANPAAARPGERLTALPGRVPAPAEWPRGCRFQARCPFATEECGRGPIPLTTCADGRQVRCIRWEEVAGAGS
ncbi:MAG TPA: dipeptide/oligopeptide/nickel ABC transporter permease/ATP-binding protein [Pseudonocardia sp.]|uniref:dipeptide/oligopeptide/nickel ABC transporter permease/ATP-binding protein n=1 Tax=Pseudonocardia sp. TaxID=60912 RepID=UPI002B4B8DC7|nr:dipeptide/oligopeptide/nickel ABC transporter permease/ATP-binding protein [Pseudonocardia sp.]HLU54804.1 dipeptide/oligopeptide/nickel ABC transporter permease/ATP-binding protein [Pseudonocardia sp.]